MAILKNKQTLEIPIVGQTYIGKHGEKIRVSSIGTDISGRVSVGYWTVGPKYEQHHMELARFMKWAKDDPDAKPVRTAAEVNPFADARSTPCDKNDWRCGRFGYVINGKYHCDNHYVVAERKPLTPGSYIYEVPVYDGAMKYWRVLNLNSGTVYSNHHDELEDSAASIKDGEERAGKIVKRLSLQDLIRGIE